MSSSYSANQYENAFKSQKLQNWTVPKSFKERPCAVEGYTCFIASDRGHLLPGVKVKRGSAWPDFRGTWELPARIPAVSINPTSRSDDGRNRLSAWGLDPQRTTTTTTTTQQPNVGPQDPAELSQAPTLPPPQTPTAPQTPPPRASQGGERPASHASSERAASRGDASVERPATGASAGRERPASQRDPSEPQAQTEQPALP